MNLKKLRIVVDEREKKSGIPDFLKKTTRTRAREDTEIVNVVQRKRRNISPIWMRALGCVHWAGAHS